MAPVSKFLKLHKSQILLDFGGGKFDNMGLPEKRTQQFSLCDQPYGYRRALLAAFKAWPERPPHSHSIVPGGLLVTSSVTRLIPLTSMMMRLAVRPNVHCDVSGAYT
jgi:hypothetical protein